MIEDMRWITREGNPFPVLEMLIDSRWIKVPEINDNDLKSGSEQ